MPWTIKCYCPPDREKSKAQQAYDSGSFDLQAAFDAEVNYLRKVGREDWRRPRAAKLTRGKKTDFRDYYEIRFMADNVQQRPIGYFGPGKNDFTILIWAHEKGNSIVPTKWRTQADNARDNLERDASYARKFQFEKE